jgi:L-fucose mutarotase
MLKGLNPLLTPDLIFALRAMGHGDEITIVDGNYPAESAGPDVARIDGANATDVLDAVLSVMPLDDYAPEACWCMDPGPGVEEPPIFAQFRAIIAKYESASFTLKPIERFAFYAKASGSFSIVATGEPRLFGNIILKKGVIRPK